MAHKVICYNCGETFDRDKVPFKVIPFGRVKRYAHQVCPKPPSEQQIEKHEKDDFFQTVKQIFGKDYDFLMIETQALTYQKEYGYSWSGMKKTLRWFYIINNHSTETGHGGIGIIPYVYKEAEKYYRAIYETEIHNHGIEIGRDPVVFNIQSPRAWERPPHLLNLEDEDENR